MVGKGGDDRPSQMAILPACLAQMLYVRLVVMSFNIFHDASGIVVRTVWHVADSMEEFVGGHLPYVSLLVLQKVVGSHAVLIIRKR